MFYAIFGVNLTVQDLLHQDARIQDLYFNISVMKLSITSLFSVQIMSYLGASDIIYSDVIDVICARTQGSRISTLISL